MSLDEPIGLNTQENSGLEGIQSRINKKIALAVGIAFLVILVIVVLLSPKSGIKINNRAIITPPLAIVTVTPGIAPTRWASDSAVLKIENDNRDLLNNIGNTDLSEPALSLPNVDMKVDFQK